MDRYVTNIYLGITARISLTFNSSHITITITKILFRQQLKWNVHVKCEK